MDIGREPDEDWRTLAGELDDAMPVSARDRLVPALCGSMLALLWVLDWLLGSRHFVALLCGLPVAALAWRRWPRLAGLGAAANAAAIGTVALVGSRLMPLDTLDHALTAGLVSLAAAWLPHRLRVRAERRERGHQSLQHRAFADRLTDLPNRALFLDRMAVALAQARRNDERLAVLCLDLDGFKAVNDRYGHAAGDFVLQVVATRLRACTRDSDTVARLGGDEFAILLPAVGETWNAGIVADKVLQAVAAPIVDPEGRVHEIGVSIGVSTYPRHGGEIDRLLACADAAMYESKRQGKNRCTFFEGASGAEPWVILGGAQEIGVPDIDRQHRQLVVLVNDLNRAIQAHEGPAAIRRRFDELLLFTRFHFATEERLMQDSAYGEMAAHTRRHARLLAEVGEFRDRLLAGGELLALQTIKDWLFAHIAHDDRALGEHLRRAPPP